MMVEALAATGIFVMVMLGIMKSFEEICGVSQGLFWRTTLCTAAVVAVMLSAGKVMSHEAPTGWIYPGECCSNQDCREVADADVREGPDGYVIRSTGEVVAYGDARVRRSPDGRFHWCALEDGLSGPREMSTICLFVPPCGY